MAEPRTDLRNLTEAELVAYAESLGQPGFRGKQILGWLYRPGIEDFGEMTDLAKIFRKILVEKAYISKFSEPNVQKSKDGTIKFGFKLEDNHYIESVLIPEPDRNTLCISSQVGCAMGCSFCLTAQMGFVRNLTTAEIVNQVCAVRDYLLATPVSRSADTVTNLVFMGMGEPLNNLINVIKSIEILTHPKTLDLAARRITVSTCGIVPKMTELGEKSTVNLAVSLHAADDAIRSRLMPINNRYPITELLAACRDFPMPRRKRIMFEYTLLAGINDGEDDAKLLAAKLRGIPCKINLLRYNACPGLSYQGSDEKTVMAFQKILLDAHYSVFIRSSRGADIAAACGQLATEQNAKGQS